MRRQQLGSARVRDVYHRVWQEVDSSICGKVSQPLVKTGSGGDQPGFDNIQAHHGGWRNVSEPCPNLIYQDGHSNLMPKQKCWRPYLDVVKQTKITRRHMVAGSGTTRSVSQDSGSGGSQLKVFCALWRGNRNRRRGEMEGTQIWAHRLTVFTNTSTFVIGMG
jgi:hypothetical protein